jgi:hypothetical protein
MNANPDNPHDSLRSAARSWLGRRRRWLSGVRANRRRRVARAALDGGLDAAPPVPPCPPGWSTGPPDFVGVGVQRCGTTRWFDLIAAHPEVDHAFGPRELHFFDRFLMGGHTAADIARYHSCFPRQPGHKTGEWTPLYISAPWVPSMLARSAPDARLLVLLRDPVERYLSGIELDVRIAARRGAPLSRYAPFEAYLRGLYHEQLTRLLRHFERSQVLILQYERCTGAPLPELRRTFEFIGLSDLDFTPDITRHPERQLEKPSMSADARSAYAEAYTPDVLRLAADFPEIDLELWPNFSHLAVPSRAG